MPAMKPSLSSLPARRRVRSIEVARVMLVMALLATTVAACPGIPNDGRYATFDGGRSNNRAELPAPPRGESAELPVPELPVPL
jgi:hypothetical protein